MRILLVEDDAMIGKAVLDVCGPSIHATDWVRDGGRGRCPAG
jgi:DNA-binding response OmpR family regulator